MRVLVEVRNVTVGTPAARSPFFGLALGEEETDIDSRLSGGDHIEVAIIIRRHTVERSGITVTHVRISGVIEVRVLGEVTLLSGEAEENGGLEAIVVHDVEVREETSSGLSDTNLEVSEGDQLGVYKMITLRVTWVAFHDIELGVLIGEGDGGDHIGTEINAKNEDSREGLRDLEHHEEEEGGDLRDVRGQGVGDGFLQVVEDEATLLNTIDNGGEVIVEKEHVGGVLGDFRAGTHSDTDIGLLDGG